ncbi:MAG: hypothetical protein J7484_03390, partial [Microbacterium sp.]|nr:hypothetical protein [Microbacterium sp.]
QGPSSDLPDVEPQEWPVDAGPSPYVDAATPASGSYRVLTAVIFAVLVLLLAGAIAAVVYLAGHTTFSLPGADSASDPQPAAVEVTEEAPAEVVPLIGEPCSDFCTDIGSRAGEVVVGADGGSAWQVSRSWETTELSDLPAEETAEASYDADAGTLSYTVWRFADDASAQAAYDQLNSGLGEVAYSGPAFKDGTGDQRAYIDGGIQTIVWLVVGDESRPWIMRVQGPDVSELEQFYLALPL